MSNCPQAMTPASIRYLLVLDDLCREGRGVRSVEIAARMNVSKPSAHSMLQNLCQAGLVEKERYGTVFLTPEGRRAAAEYAACFGPLCRRMQAEDYAVVELSSFQLMDMTRSPQRAVVTNLAPNHLDVHKDMEEYVEAKKNIFRFQKPGDLLVLNADNAITAGFSGAGETHFFSRKAPTNCIWQQGDWIVRRGQKVLNVHDILLPGVHNIENYMAAMAAVEGLVSDECICSVAKNFGGVEHRIELVRVKDGVKFYNDSIASSPSRTIAGLRSFSQKVILIAGGYDKHIPYDVLGPEICNHVSRLFLCGATAGKIRDCVEAQPGQKPEMVDCGDFDSAVQVAAKAAQPGDIVLMSPASASFDQFKNFMERGDRFKQLVKEL